MAYDTALLSTRRAARDHEAAAAAAAAVAVRRAKASNGRSKRDGQHDAWMSLPSDALFGDAPGKDAPGNRFATKAAPNAGIGWSYLARTATAGPPAAANATNYNKCSQGDMKISAFEVIP
jgi:hypothetical protein